MATSVAKKSPYQLLQKIRTRTDLKLKPLKHLKPTFTDFNGQERPLVVRYYQIQGIAHLVAMRQFLLGDDTGLGKCKTLDSRVLTNRGLLELGALAPKGDLLPDSFYPLDQPTRVWTGRAWAPVSKFYCGGIKPIKRIKTRRGYETTGSLVHPVWVRHPDGTEGFVEMRHLQVGDQCCLDRSSSEFPSSEPSVPVPTADQFTSNTTVYTVPDRLSPELACLLAYIVAEGWTNSRMGFNVSQNRMLNPETHEHIRQLCRDVLGWDGNGGAKNKDREIQISSVYLRAYLEGVGVVQGRSAVKQVPWPIFQGTQSSVCAFLRAYFDSEGFVSKEGVIEVSSASQKLLQDVQLLLLRFGILASRCPKRVKGYEHTYWRLTLCGKDAQLFGTAIGFLTPRKQAALKGQSDVSPNVNLDVVPHARKLIEELKQEILARVTVSGSNASRRGSGIRQFGVSFEKTLNNIRNGGRSPTYEFMGRLLEVSRQVGAKTTKAHHQTKAVCDRHLFYDPVETIEEDVQMVADIAVDDPSHAFVADGFINHNTIEAIGALCYLWGSDPNLKSMVLTTKSSAPQWVREFSKFTTGIKVVLCQGTPAQREKARKTFEESDGPTVIVMGYRSALQDFRHIQDWEKYILIADECFDYFTPIQLADGTTELIGRVVTKRMPVTVLSENPDTGEVEPKRVVAWHQVPICKGKRKALVKLQFRFSKSVRVTPNHEVYIPGGHTRSVQHLRVGHSVRHLCCKTPTEFQKQVILGGLLGDASISFPKRKLWGVVFVQSASRGRYLRFKRDVLSSLGVSKIDDTTAGYQPKTGVKTPVERFRVNGNAAVTSLLVQGRVWREGKKRVTKDWLTHVGPLGLAVWYADDGSIQTYLCKDGQTTHTITLHTQGFSRDEQELLAGWLYWRWGVKAEIKTTKERSDRKSGIRKSYPYLYLPKDEAQKFLDLLPGSLPDVEYKFPGKSPLQWAETELTPTKSVVTDWITAKESWSPKNPHIKYVYDIEVEDHHRYFAGGGVLVSNCTVFKNPATQVHRMCRHLSTKSARIWALTATLIKNNLMEGYGIYQIVAPGLFQSGGRMMSKNQFMLYFCITRMQQIPRSNRQIPVIVGYHKDKIKEFRDLIDPVFLGRPKHAVAKDLPVVVMRNIEVDLTTAQEDKYIEAKGDLLLIGEGTKVTEKETSKLTALIYHQEIVNDLGLIGITGESPKLDALVDLLIEGDLADEKVIVYSRFKKFVDIIVARLRKHKINTVRITGDENTAQRDDAMQEFQNPDSDVRVVCLTAAGAESINLQAAKALICMDTPWSAGDFLQLIGRMIRIGSTHDRCYVIHMLARAKGFGETDTIDHAVMKTLHRKMVLIEAVLGKRLKGVDDDEFVISADNDISDLFTELKSTLQGGGGPA